MIKSTFCHLPGINIAAERSLWSSGVHSWDSLLLPPRHVRLPRGVAGSLSTHIERSFESLVNNDPNYFAGLLPSNQHWRLFPDFRHSIAYLDIETTGLGYSDSITTIAIYDGKTVRHYVRGRNLDDFRRDIREHSVVVTYNGKCFDAPFIERSFGIRMNHVHIDLRYILKALGYTGGLKACERHLGLDREGLEGVDGNFAVLLWDDYIRNRNERALETLLAYNIQDVVNLEVLLVIAYNLNLKATPFRDSHRLASPSPPLIPFTPDRETINRIRATNFTTSWYGRGYRRR